MSTKKVKPTIIVAGKVTPEVREMLMIECVKNKATLADEKSVKKSGLRAGSEVIAEYCGQTGKPLSEVRKAPAKKTTDK